MVVIQWQNCWQYNPAGVTCATPQEFQDYFSDVIIVLEVADHFVKFSEPSTELAVETRVNEVLFVDTGVAEYSNIMGKVEMSPV